MHTTGGATRLLLLSVCATLTGCDAAMLTDPEALDAVTRSGRPGGGWTRWTDALSHGPQRIWDRPGASIWDDYPPALRRAGQPRQVRLALRVDAGGRVASVRVTRSSGAPDVDARAVAVAKTWAYVPARRDGRPEAVWLEDVWVGWPLVVVDGVVRPEMEAEELRALTPLIEHVEITKGRASGLLYGAWASSGVIEITTRREGWPR